MEPNNSTGPGERKPAFDGGTSDFEGLHAEGVDIVGSGIGEENVPLITVVDRASKPPAAPAPRNAAPEERQAADTEADRRADLASVRSAFETSRIKEAFAASSTEPAPAKAPAPTTPQKAPEKPAQTTQEPSPAIGLVPEKPRAPEPEPAPPAFQRMSFGIAPNMPKGIEPETAPASKPQAPIAPPAPAAPTPAKETPAEPSPASAPPKPVYNPPAQTENPASKIAAAAGPTVPAAAAAPAPSPTPGPIEPAPAAQKPVPSAAVELPKVEMPVSKGLKNDPSIKPIRTFKTDAEEAVRYQNVSAIDIAVAEQKKKEVAPTPIEYEEGKKSSAGLFISTIVVLIALIAGGWYYWYSTTAGNTPLSASEPASSEPARSNLVSAQTIIPYQNAAAIMLDPGSDPLILIATKLAAGNGGLGGVYALVPTLGATSTEAASASSVFAQTRIPARLARSLGESYMIGTYTLESQSPFLILTNTFFQNAFSGMLEWEQDLRNDLLPLIRIAHPNEAGITANTDAFEDAVVSNIDTRVLRNASGETILAYAFADKDTIVITTGTESLEYVLGKLLAVRTIQ